MAKVPDHIEIWDAKAADSYDTPGTGMFSTDVLDPAVERLSSLAQGGRVLEFAIGTGRVAIPLRDRGLQVAGIEIATEMLRRLREKVDEQSLPVVLGDMTTARVPGAFSLVFLVFNGISNVLTQEEQIECFRNAARHLGPGGRFVIELWVPQLPPPPPAPQAITVRSEDGYILVDTFDTVNQLLVSNHFGFRDGEQVTLFRSPHRYVWPSELDMMARLAGFELEERGGD